MRTNLFCRLSDFNSIQLGKMTSPHSTLIVHQTTKNQQAKQNCVNLVQYLDIKSNQFNISGFISALHTYTWSNVKVIDPALVLPVVFFQEIQHIVSSGDWSVDGNDCWSGFGWIIGDNTKLIRHSLDEQGLPHTSAFGGHHTNTRPTQI